MEINELNSFESLELSLIKNAFFRFEDNYNFLQRVAFQSILEAKAGTTDEETENEIFEEAEKEINNFLNNELSYLEDSQLIAVLQLVCVKFRETIENQYEARADEYEYLLTTDPENAGEPEQPLFWESESFYDEIIRFANAKISDIRSGSRDSIPLPTPYDWKRNAKSKNSIPEKLSIKQNCLVYHLREIYTDLTPDEYYKIATKYFHNEGKIYPQKSFEVALGKASEYANKWKPNKEMPLKERELQERIRKIIGAQ